MVQLTDIKKFYGSFLALQIPLLQIPSGIHWMQGVNGSGKTTLLKITAGLLPFGGDIIIQNGISIKKDPIQYRRYVNYAEAEPLYPSFLSGMDLVHLFIKAKNGDLQQTKELMDALNVLPFINHPVGTYSSGMQKKLSLTLAFIGPAKVILLDEPLVTIDTASVKIIYALIEKYHTEKEVTFILTSHQNFDEYSIGITSKLVVKDQTVIQVL